MLLIDTRVTRFCFVTARLYRVYSALYSSTIRLLIDARVTLFCVDAARLYRA